MAFDLATLILGILIGWVTHWLLSYFFWTESRAYKQAQVDFQVPIDDLTTEVNALKAQVESVTAERDSAEMRIAELEAELAACVEQLPVEIDMPERGDPGYSNDLTQIWGIGPKVQDVLNDAGIYTFGQLATATQEELDALMEAAGPRYTLANHESWPGQASLAAADQWDELQTLQDKLDWESNAGHAE
jgi:predicted flap endonuclease-1-like 5' DNA nuclease